MELGRFLGWVGLIGMGNTLPLEWQSPYQGMAIPIHSPPPSQILVSPPLFRIPCPPHTIPIPSNLYPPPIQPIPPLGWDGDTGWGWDTGYDTGYLGMGMASPVYVVGSSLAWFGST